MGVKLIISGGQTGVDQAALRAAKTLGIPTGGYAPAGWLTEDGPAPWLAEYGLTQCDEPGYPPRTRANIQRADATLLLVWGAVGHRSSGSRLALKLALQAGKPITTIDLTRSPDVPWALHLLPDVRVLNVAGNRESLRPGLIGSTAETFLAALFVALKEKV